MTESALFNLKNILAEDEFMNISCSVDIFNLNSINNLKINLNYKNNNEIELQRKRDLEEEQDDFETLKSNRLFKVPFWTYIEFYNYESDLFSLEGCNFLDKDFINHLKGDPEIQNFSNDKNFIYELNELFCHKINLNDNRDLVNDIFLKRIKKLMKILIHEEKISNSEKFLLNLSEKEKEILEKVKDKIQILIKNDNEYYKKVNIKKNINSNKRI